ncbi:hypothetical protein BOW53_04160 [Solemya pervernicosa gill symbiont]|uniref:Transcriptional antiterminator, Rof n=2 Tax=Gammaproteobacteria incertae sedis TaxID=118884 RepID=A0A1T2L884_9GAMM|nr:hypothetical protein [Candidatus Reidiella endopervernicosa]OOZ41318.1 hypothetical protein BOW53_04160 [Solemya pervernicosa gill symbiont]QKQ27704.1 transcriptional antiterminator, Rof [Candidatus Reidiella endopervernicosa]
MSDDYTPIDCGLYSRFEVAIMHRCRLRLSWSDVTGTAHIDTVMPLDLETREGSEYLIAESSLGDAIRLRLDLITSFDPVDECIE